MKKYIAISILLLFIIGSVFSERWPMGPGNVVRELGNNCYEYAHYGSSPYYHDGLDVMGAAGDPVYSVDDGYLVQLSIWDPMYTGMFINYSATGQDLGWCYWHITSTTIPFIEGDAVSEGDYIGDIATWSVASFHHVHFTRSLYPGNGGETYNAVDNPIEFLVPSAEPDAPVFGNAQTGQLFSFVENDTNNVVSASSVSGTVDIIAKIHDTVESSAWDIAPYRIDWWIENSSGITVVPTTLFVEFTGDCPDDSTVNHVYKDSGIWNSEGDFDDRDFYFIITNTDGDGIVESTDHFHGFFSNSLSNGTYTLFVRASDFAGNETTEFMDFTINNPPGENTLDIVQVLDRSGSMTGYTSSGSTDQKIDVLKYASDEFIRMMTPDIGNKLGIVQFNENVVPFGTPVPDLKELTSSNVTDYRDSVSSINAGGYTSMGDGLNEALHQLTTVSDPNPNREILLISDGKENRSLYIADVQPDLVAHGIPVHALGLGYNYGINEVTLINLATATGGSYRITSDDILFRKYFLEILAEAADWSVIVDPIGYADTKPAFVEVPVGGFDSKVIVTAFWEGINADNGLELILISPSGKRITPETINANIKYVEHPRYAFYRMEFPLAGDLSSEHAGMWYAQTWKNPDAGTVRYSVEAMAVSPLQLQFSMNAHMIYTGEPIQFKATLTQRGEPVTGSEVVVYGDIPELSIDNLLYHEKIVIDNGFDPDIKGDPVTIVDRKIDILEKMYGEKLFATRQVECKLFDDGEHGDGKANDGIYGGTLDDTKIPGSYSFRCVAGNIYADSSKNVVTRENTASIHNLVHIDPVASIIKSELSIIDKQTVCSLFIIPRDRFENYHGPDHEVRAKVVYAQSGREISVNDNTNGTYETSFILTPEEIKYGAKIILYIDGKEFTTIDPFKA